MQALLVILLLCAVESTWEEIPTPEGWQTFFIPSSVHQQLQSCVNDLEDLRQHNEILRNRYDALLMHLDFIGQENPFNIIEAQRDIADVGTSPEEWAPLTPRLLNHSPTKSIKSSGRSSSAPPTARSDLHLVTISTVMTTAVDSEHSSTKSNTSNIDRIETAFNSDLQNQESIEHHDLTGNSTEMSSETEILSLSSGLVIQSIEPMNHSVVMTKTLPTESPMVQHEATDETNTNVPPQRLSASARRKKKKQKKKNDPKIVNEIDSLEEEDIDEVLAQYRANGVNGPQKEKPMCSQERTLTIYESDDASTIHELEMDLAINYVSDLVVIQSFAAHSHSSAHSESRDFRFPGLHSHVNILRVVARSYSLGHINTAILDYIECFKIGEGSSRFEYDSDALPLWLKTTISLLRKHKETNDYYQHFKDWDELSINTTNQRHVIQIMDLINFSVTKEKTSVNLQGLHSLFATEAAWEIAAGFFGFVMDKLLRDQATRMVDNYHSFNLSQIRFVGSHNVTEFAEILDDQIQEFKEHIECAILLMTESVLGNEKTNGEDLTAEVVVETLQLLNRITTLQRKWICMNAISDFTAVISQWMSIPELKQSHVHLTKYGTWPDEELEYFHRLTARYNLTLVRYKVSKIKQLNTRGTRSGQRQSKMAKKADLLSRSRLPHVILNKYEVRPVNVSYVYV